MINIFINEDEFFPVAEMLEIFHSHNLNAAVTSQKSKADIVFIRLNTMIDDKYLDQFANLKVLISPTTGLNHVSISSVNRRGIKLYSLRGEKDFLKSITPTADLAFSCILSSFTRLTSASYDTANNHVFDRTLHFRSSFKQLRVGFVGMGRLGSLVSEYIHNIGGSSGYFDPYVEQSESIYSTKLPSLEYLFEEYDLISIHAIANEATNSLITLEHLQINPPYSIINTSRASILPSVVIEAAFSHGLLAQIFADTLDEEPISSPHDIINTHLFKLQKLYGSNRIIITPHIGGACKSSIRQCELFLSSKAASEFIS